MFILTFTPKCIPLNYRCPDYCCVGMRHVYLSSYWETHFCVWHLRSADLLGVHLFLSGGPIFYIFSIYACAGRSATACSSSLLTTTLQAQIRYWLLQLEMDLMLCNAFQWHYRTLEIWYTEYSRLLCYSSLIYSNMQILKYGKRFNMVVVNFIKPRVIQSCWHSSICMWFKLNFACLIWIYKLFSNSESTWRV